MFERYTEPARRIIFFGRYEASTFGSRYIETHHLVLGMMRECWWMFASFLGDRAEMENIRRALIERYPVGPAAGTSVDLPMSRAAKRALAYAAEESELRREAHITPVHLLVGVLRVGENAVVDLLARHGMDVDSVRKRVAGPTAAEARGGSRSQDLAEACRMLIDMLPEERLDAARRILDALGEETVTVAVRTADEEFTISFP